MNRIDRISAILIQLQSKRIVTAKEIADRFEISLRTVYRDIRTLEEAGVPIGAEAGLGYYIMEGYRLPPILFTKDEAASLIMGEKFIEKMTDTQTKDSFKSALFKVKSVLKNSDKDFLESVSNSIHIQHSGTLQPSEDLAALKEVQNSIASSTLIELTYHSKYNDTVSKRIVEPIGLLYYFSNWHLIGYCTLRKDYRDFRSDRIQNISILNQRFNPQERITLQEYIKTSHDKVNLNPTTIRIKNEYSSIVASSKYYFGFQDETEVGDEIEMNFYVANMEYFARWLISFTNAVTVIKPPSLKDEIHTLLQELTTHFSHT